MFPIKPNKSIVINLIKWTNLFRSIKTGRTTTLTIPQTQTQPQLSPHQQHQSLEIEQLMDRTLLKINGRHVDEYLQSLITNDLSYIQKSIGSLYTMFLNDHGRLITDGILYKTSESNSYLLDIDMPAIGIVQQHLNKYTKSNSSIQITNYGSKLNVWQIFSSDALRIRNEADMIKTNVNCAKRKWLNNDLQDLVMVYSDPRSPQLGLRIIASNDIDFNQIIQKLNIKRRHNLTTYKQLRYKLGIAEGVQELPPNKSSPLESNGDYLNGIHFNKGRYLGGDITISLYLNGFIHYRMTPVIFDGASKVDELNFDDPIIIEHTKKQMIVGKLRGTYDKYGIALLRTDYINRDDMVVKNVKVKAPKPDWWPVMLTNEMPEQLWATALR
ncbi:putative transferase CAF17 homolog, mitochondrial [Chrysoperla carnea]|uniref:putative transferase CAF17 homolog, mitochondrial n=1 Tax=Chrysoperla carnea TaxID=189513 RepID=UPI001D0689E5|nr:putative transferase CAF17 homolog, mitochondrial [Chrysoperla carnea]